MRRWWTRLGVRARSALAAVLVVAVVFAVAAVAFVLLDRNALVAIADAAAAGRATAIADRVAAGDDAGTVRLLAIPPGESMVAQVVTSDGTVLWSSIRGAAAISPSRPGPGVTQRQDRLVPDQGDDPFRIVAQGVRGPGGARIVLVGKSLDPAVDSEETEITLLLVGYPLLLLAVGAATAFFVGRSLRAVEVVRTRVAGITARRLHDRVPVPVAQDEVHRLAVTMNEMLDRLEAASQAQRRFVADASHELRSPLTTLRIGLELQPGQDVLLAEAGRLQGLVDDLLLLARVDERGVAPRYTDVDLDDLVDAERLRLAGQPHLTVEATIEPVRVWGDRGQLTRALRNVVDNAARHAGTHIMFALFCDGDEAHIVVGNDGPAIPVEDRERIFDRFTRLDPSRSGGGSGLGLAIVREIVDGHHGRIVVSDTPTAFRIVLPLRHGK